ncbi:DNA-directed RNA polymerase subunit K [Methanohalophilus halophilus]|uniref:DNA-directed RNA polymerase subunit Rpo6 n=1 Tax=Methanohalophilus halophilus TaxID=2177 RepID=A0A1L3Q2J2_9EURY|nr:DNA-directed RNA polymerase subunit K [Methanohalophilus halophilus]APH39079.1 DNA-directed RNA polymerase subunit K [Methanohalophilus halophilus]RNI09865.1 DNA-directed RNA polymerase subunit K [Methanohalophilus halophilus]SDW92855.1 DNA-directed RNA polymerase, subunit K [Methanohalophilus halophilus]
MSNEKFTKYERARIIGARSLQISMEAPVLIDIDSNDSLQIAKFEFEMGVIPITVKRDISS